MRGILVHDKEFVKLHQACRHSLNGLHIEAHQTLNLLMLLKLFPDDVERETALQLQCDREKKVKAEYQRQRRGLFALVTISPAVGAMKIEPPDRSAGSGEKLTQTQPSP